MTCRRVHSLIPLYAGDDLRPRLAWAVRTHVDACPGCREELEGFRAAMAGVKTAAKAEGVPDWNEGKWNAVMARVAAEARGAGSVPGSVGMRVFRPRWAAATALGAVLGLVVLSLLFRGPAPQPERAPAGSGMVIASGDSRQDKIAITMISPDSGLQVVWFLDKNFDYEGEQE